MPLTKLQFRPGIVRETTSYTNEGGWFDGDKVRFRAGLPEKIGGWTRYSNSSFLGSCRAMHQWRTLGLKNYLGMGTNLKYYVESGQGFYDVTPIRLTTDAGDVTFSATDGSSTLTVTHTSHGEVVNSFVTYSGAVSLGGTITADVLNQEYQIASIIDADTYTIVARESAPLGSITIDGQYTPTPVAANSSDTGDGGSSVIGAYQINAGLDTSLFGNGWGAGAWGRQGWGEGAELSALTDVLRLWTHDNFGEDLVMNVADGGLYYWDSSSGLSARAVALEDLAGASDAPTVARRVIVSDNNRHVLAFGCNPVGSSVQDPLLVRFSDQENVADWTPTPTNTAGDLLIGSGSRIITAIETRQQVLVFTDVSLHAVQYLGPPFTFGVSMLSENVTIAGLNAAAAVQDTVYWMGQNEFYVYSGAVQKLPCTVKDYVFSDFNNLQAEKVFTATNSAFSEVWWFYPSASSSNIDRYVVFNYEQQVWYYGTLDRSAWVDRGLNNNPIAAGLDGYLYNHEDGFDDGSNNPATAITAYIESSQVDIADGNQFSFVSRIIPDITFRNSTAAVPIVTLTLKARNFPGGQYLQEDDGSVSKTASSPVEQFTNEIFVRLRGRSLALRIESDETGVGWRLGSPRIDLRPDGRR